MRRLAPCLVLVLAACATPETPRQAMKLGSGHHAFGAPMITSGVGGIIVSVIGGALTKSKAFIGTGVTGAVFLGVGSYLYYLGDSYFDEADTWEKERAVKVRYRDRIRNERYIEREQPPKKKETAEKRPASEKRPLKTIPERPGSGYSEEDCRVIARLCAEKGLTRSDCKVYQKHCGPEGSKTRTSTKAESPREVFLP